MSRWARWRYGAGLGLALGACADRTPTQLLVIVDSDIALVGSSNALTEIEVRLMSSDGARSLAPAELFVLDTQDGGAERSLPLSFALTPETVYQEGLFRLVVSGKNAAHETLVQKQTFTAFRQGEARVLEMFLQVLCVRKCQGAPIPGDLTCTAGTCGEIPTKTELRALEGDGLSDYEPPFFGSRQVLPGVDVTPPPEYPLDAGGPEVGPPLDADLPTDAPSIEDALDAGVDAFTEPEDGGAQFSFFSAP